jgi:hypothetical protein
MRDAHSGDGIMTDNTSRQFPGAGGTSGGIGEFFLGLTLFVVGMYLFLSRVIVVSNLWTLLGMNAFGIALIPLVLGIALLFYNSRSIAGWVLAVGSFLIIIVGIIVNLSFFFMPTNLLVTLLMLALIGAGAGLMLRAIRPRG